MTGAPEHPRRRRAFVLCAVVLLGLPLICALLGPWLADPADPRSGAYAPPSSDALLGTDFVGRDVVDQVLLGGRTVVLVGGGAAVAAYIVGVPWGMCAAAARRRWVDEVLMRPLDILLSVPSLLTLLLIAGLSRPGPLVLGGVVSLIMLPEVARISRAAALAAASGPAMEAMLLTGESWWRRNFRYLGGTVLPTLATDFGMRIVGALYLVASAAFLGVGVAPDAADWAVMVDRNRPGLFLQPWAVLVPALLVTAMSVGLNLLFDQALHRRRETT
ncbi:ABC transporter permease [Streptodolium elevatio]|uniref:ABC transporter permease subunit n=1 Tax=Streptodolium elevatio TaxID=3157996 RepID=A0ABV3DCG0_9ACTN